MKRITLILILIFIVVIVVSFVSCEGTSISTKKYDEISNYVLENKKTISPEKEIEFFDYDTSGLYDASVYYGYYYTVDNEIVIPDFYSSDNLGEQYESDEGTYLGKPNNGTDWYFVRKITDNWYYYELHWG